MASRPEDQAELSRVMGRRLVRGETTSSLSEDAKLVSAARDGDRTAFGRLYDRYAHMVHGVLLSKVPIGEVDDLVQDVFMMALKRLSTLREEEKFGAWLATIARNLSNDYHRRSVPEEQLTDDAADTTGHGNRGGYPEGMAADILEVVKSLPDALKETLILRLVEGMTGPEIAARTGMTHGSVRVNLHRGMQQLRAKLKSNVPEQERP